MKEKFKSFLADYFDEEVELAKVAVLITVSHVVAGVARAAEAVSGLTLLQFNRRADVLDAPYKAAREARDREESGSKPDLN